MCLGELVGGGRIGRDKSRGHWNSDILHERRIKKKKENQLSYSLTYHLPWVILLIDLSKETMNRRIVSENATLVH